MDPRQLFMDERLTGYCAFCGDPSDTRDHIPPKVFLDEPYPRELPVVGACKECNSGTSLDEEYLACFLECVICGTTNPLGVKREKVRRILESKPRLRERIAESKNRDKTGSPIWTPELDRVQRVILKLARGHAAYEVYPHLEEPCDIDVVPLIAMSERDRRTFERWISGPLQPWPELGSRAFMRAIGKSPDKRETSGGWILVQPRRYRYSVLDGTVVQIVLNEYLACRVEWK